MTYSKANIESSPLGCQDGTTRTLAGICHHLPRDGYAFFGDVVNEKRATLCSGWWPAILAEISAHVSGVAIDVCVVMLPCARHSGHRPRPSPVVVVERYRRL